MKKSSLLLLAALVGSAAFGAEPDHSEKARITGMVVDTDGKPAAGVEVRRVDSDDAPVRTGADGNFVLPMKQCTAQVCLVASDASGARIGLWEKLDATFLPSIVNARITLQPSVAVKVSVVDDKGALVSGANVMAVSSLSKVVASMRTDDSGVATLRLPVIAEIRNIFAMKPGIGFDYMENFSGPMPWPAVDLPPPELTLTLSGVRTIQVLALGTDGKPVAGVEFAPSSIRMSDRKWYLSVNPVTPQQGLIRTTDANGMAIFDDLPSSITHLILDTHDRRYGTQRNPSFGSRDNRLLDDGPMVLTTRVLRTQSLSGKVLLPGGSPAAGILVNARGMGYGLPSYACTRTRADGSFTLSADSERSYLVGVTDERWAAASLSGVVVKEGSDHHDLLLQLVQGTLVSGLVTDLLNGAPLSSQTVTVVELGAKIDPAALLGFDKQFNPQEELRRSVQTDAIGRYTLRLGPGTFRFESNRVKPISRYPMKQIQDQAEVVQDLKADPDH